MFYHMRQPHYFTRPYPVYQSPLSSNYADEEEDMYDYRRLAWEHKRKAEQALLLAEEQEYRRRQLQLQRAIELERLRRQVEAERRANYLACCRSPPQQQPHRKPAQRRPLNSACLQNAHSSAQDRCSCHVKPTPRAQSMNLGDVFSNEIRRMLESSKKGEVEAAKAPAAPTTTPRPNTTPTPVTITPSSPTPSARSSSSSWSSIESIQEAFTSLKASFTFPSSLEFNTTPDSSSPTLTYSSTNAPVHQYESDLTKLLTRLDAVESFGAESLRGARKALVIAIERELEKLDERKNQIWENQQRQSVLREVRAPSSNEEEEEVKLAESAEEFKDVQEEDTVDLVHEEESVAAVVSTHADENALTTPTLEQPAATPDAEDQPAEVQEPVLPSTTPEVLEQPVSDHALSSSASSPVENIDSKFATVPPKNEDTNNSPTTTSEVVSVPSTPTNTKRRSVEIEDVLDEEEGSGSENGFEML